MAINPYQSPKVAEESSTSSSSQWLLTYVQFIATGTLVSAVTRMAINAILAWDSPEYFDTMMHWHNSNDSGASATLKTALEGAVFGFLLSTFFIMVAGVLTRGRITLERATAKLALIVIGAVCLTYFAGAVGSMCADGFPGPMRELLPMAPREPRRFFRFAFVTVSMIAVPWSAFLSAILQLCLLYREELQATASKSAD